MQRLNIRYIRNQMAVLNNDKITTSVIIPKKPSSRCDYEGCKNKRAAIIGDCCYCSLKYCAQHRLPELHKCDNLDACCKKAQKENSDRLKSQALSNVQKV
jgi:predicted nucleic acid binding AN1-type Zn finger protein